MFTKGTSIVEILLYHSLHGHPSFCDLLESKITPEENELSIPLGKSNPFPPLDRISEYMKVVLEGVLTLHHHGIVYGDIKQDNVIDLGGKYKMIDLDLCHFTRAIPFRVCQTFGDEMHAEYANMKRQTYDTVKEVVWSLGYLLYTVCEATKGKEGIEAPRSATFYSKFLPNPYISTETPKEWIPFAKACFKRYDKRPNSIIDLLPLVPVPICNYSEKFSYEITPNRLNGYFNIFFDEYFTTYFKLYFEDLPDYIEGLVRKALKYFFYPMTSKETDKSVSNDFGRSFKREEEVYFTFCMWVIACFFFERTFEEYYTELWINPLDREGREYFSIFSKRLTTIPEFML